MSDTIGLLEEIGSDASLRHASPEALGQALDDMHASDGLRQAALREERTPLLVEFGQGTNMAVQVTYSPHDGGCVEDDDDDGFENEPSGDEDDHDDKDDR